MGTQNLYIETYQYHDDGYSFEINVKKGDEKLTFTIRRRNMLYSLATVYYGKCEKYGPSGSSLKMILVHKDKFDINNIIDVIIQIIIDTYGTDHNDPIFAGIRSGLNMKLSKMTK